MSKAKLKLRSSTLKAKKSFQEFVQEPGIGDMVRFISGEYIAHDFIYRTDLHDGDHIVIDGEPQYRLRRLRVNHQGLNAYIIQPLKGGDVHVVFRGTNPDPSIHRDLELDGPGHYSYKKDAASILRQINSVLRQVNANNQENLTVNVYGHSLGGADAQRCFVDLMGKIDNANDLPDAEEKREQIPQTNHFHRISGLRLMAYSSAGVPQRVADKAHVLAHRLAARRDRVVDLDCYWLHSAGDGVQQSGEASILANVSPEVARVRLLKVYAHDKVEAKQLRWYELNHYFNMYRMKDAHTKLFFEAGRTLPRMEFYDNCHPHGRLHIRKKLLNKSPFFQSPIMMLTQKLMVPMIDYFFPHLRKKQNTGTGARPVGAGIDKSEPVFASLKNMARTFPEDAQQYADDHALSENPMLKGLKSPWWKYALISATFCLGLALSVTGLGIGVGVTLMVLSTLYTAYTVYKDVKEQQRVDVINEYRRAVRMADYSKPKHPGQKPKRPQPAEASIIHTAGLFLNSEEKYEEKQEAPAPTPPPRRPSGPRASS